MFEKTSETKNIHGAEMGFYFFLVCLPPISKLFFLIFFSEIPKSRNSEGVEGDHCVMFEVQV